MKYTLLQIPGLIALILILLLVKRWVNLSLWFISGIIVLWVIKDAVLFPFVWRAYDSNRPGDPLTMIGERGIARERFAGACLMPPFDHFEILPDILRDQQLSLL